jgi:hypothetical protein
MTLDFYTRVDGSRWQSWKAVFVFFSCFVLLVERALAQGSNFPDSDMFRRPSESINSRDANRYRDPNQIKAIDNPTTPERHLSATGKPCITLDSYVTAQLINKNIYEHWIKAANSCGQNIKVQVCYRQSDDCIVMNVPPYENKNAVLGIQPDMKQFQYDAKEK